VRKDIFGALLALVLVFGVLTTGCIKPAETPAPPVETPPPKVIYEGTLYVAGMGGHFAKAEVTIDPENTASPITINKLTRVKIGNKTSHPVHDPRIDVKDKNIMFWSTYLLDPDAGNKLHVGKTDLTTKKVILDVEVDPPAESQKKPWYCASGQTENEFIPVSMSYEGYIDVRDKATLALKHRVFITGGEFPTNYKFHHGTNTPDMKQFLLLINKADAPHGKPIGEIDLYLLDMAALVNGQAKVNKKNTITGAPGATIGFRQTFTSDGKYLLASGRDRFYLIDGATLTVLDEEMMPKVDDMQVENHDAMPTPDNKYAVLTLRYPVPKGPEGKLIMDGQIQLYDIAKKEVVGEPVSTCIACHEDQEVAEGLSAVLCGIDGVWKEEAPLYVGC
jgi:hypothetical protein